jgi:hypothetical protein
MTSCLHSVPLLIGIGIVGIVALLGVQPHAMAMAQTQPNNTISTNQSLVTYENKEYGFAFEHPATWHIEFDAYEAQLNNYVVSLADPYSNDTDGIEQTIFRVNVSEVRKSLDSDFQIRTDTVGDYARNQVNEEIKADNETNFLLRTETVLGRSGGSLHTLDNLKNTTTTIGGEKASMVQYIQSYEGEQMVFNTFVFVIKDDKVYELSFYSEPLKAPETLPIAEKIIQSFRFI